MYKRIVLAYDGSELSNKAVDHGVTLAKDTGAGVTLLYVVTPHHLLVGGGHLAPGLRQFENQYAAELRQHAKEMLESVAQRVRAAGCTADVLVEDGTHPYANIVEAAKRLHADLIVMAGHGRGSIASLMVGSQTVKVLAHATVPVLVVR
ncbi:MAG: universal stress protein [Burkholderiales bacterium]|nr:universal stress protein [Burkholderiales bacterium]